MAADGVRALARGLELLRVFASRPAVSLTEAAAATGLPLPTALRALRTLEAAGFVERGEDGDYRPGLAILELAPAVLASLRLPEAARPRVRALAEETGETANLATLEGADVVYLVSHSGARLLTVNTPPGLRLPAHCTALGKCLLAQLDPADARARLGDGPYERHARATRTTWAALRRDLAAVRARGYALSAEELEDGLCSCAVPVTAGGGRLFALNVSVPASRWSARTVERTLLPALDRARAGLALLAA